MSILLLSGFAIFLQSCVSEEKLDLPPDDNVTNDFTESVAIVSIQRAIQNKTLSENGCLQFFYPIQFRFNNDIQISIADFDGLKDAANNATIAQHINAVEYPITVSKAGTIKTITTEQEFIDVLDECEIPTLRDEFDPFFIQCFDLIYPITMLDIDSNEVTIANKEEYFEFEKQQGFDQQPKFIYPLELFDYAQEGNVLIESPFQLFKTFDTCKKCPELFFEIDSVIVNTYVFKAEFERIDEISYGWYINDEKVEEDGGIENGDNILEETFESGTYTICIRTALPNDDCFTGTEFCQVITVDACPHVSFETIQLSSNSYEFVANFESKDLFDYHWNIYQNDMLIFSELEDSTGDNKLIYQFEPGFYEVCLQTEIDGCPEVISFCTELSIE
ncbi:hypothetical protein [Ekhidna sp.]